jgi:hypothetical protein
MEVMICLSVSSGFCIARKGAALFAQAQPFSDPRGPWPRANSALSLSESKVTPRWPGYELPSEGQPMLPTAADPYRK